jgi:hypothetical protein
MRSDVRDRRLDRAPGSAEVWRCAVLSNTSPVLVLKAAFQDRPKMGLGVWIDSRLRGGALKEWAETLLDEKRLPDQGIFNPDPIRTKWSEHLSGTCNGIITSGTYSCFRHR